MAQRPLTQQELKRVNAQKQNEPQMTVYNCSKSLLQLHMCDPNGDFYLNEHVVRLKPGQLYTDKESRFNKDQVNNLCIKNQLRLQH